MTIAADEDGNLFEKTDAGEWVPAKTRTGADVPMEVQDGGKWVPVPGTPPPYDESMLPEGGAAVGALARRAAGAVAEHFTTPPPQDSALSRIVGATARGATEGGPFYKPETRAAVDQGLVGRYITNPLLDAGKAVVGAVAGGAGQAAYEAGNALGGPRLGRDLYMFNQVAPVASMMPGVIKPGGGPVAPGTIARNTAQPWEAARTTEPVTAEAFPPGTPDYNFSRGQRIEQFLSEQPPEVVAAMARTNPDVAAWVQRQAAAEQAGVAERQGGGGAAEPPPADPQPAAPAEAPAPGEARPQSVGAAATIEGTPELDFALTPKEAAAYRETAEGSKLIEPQQPSFADHKEYIPGVTITGPEAAQTAVAARRWKALKAQEPRLADDEAVQADLNNTKYTNHVDNLGGSPTMLRLAKEERDVPAAATREQLWANQQPTDARPVVDAANEILSSGEGRRKGIRGPVNEAIKELYDADGKLITEPRILYGVRQAIGDMMDAKDITGAKVNAVAIGQLTRLKDVLDGVIENGAPGFGKYLSDFAEASRRINEMEVLQGYRNSLFDSHGIIQPARVQKMMRDIVDARGAAGLQAEKSISPETMQGLWDLRDSLRRKAAADRLGKAPGSDTSQTLFDTVREQAEGKAGTAVAGGLGLLLGAGNPIAGLAGAGAQMWLSHAAGARRYAKGLEMLNPNRLLTPTPPPPAP